jgi:hypothetical protein
VANIDRCVLGPPGAVLGPPYRVGGNRAMADGPTPASRVPAQTYQDCRTWSASWGAAAGRRQVAIRSTECGDLSQRNGSATLLNPSLAL